MSFGKRNHASPGFIKGLTESSILDTVCSKWMQCNVSDLCCKFVDREK